MTAATPTEHAADAPAWIEAEPTPTPEEERQARREQMKSDVRWGVVFLMWFMFAVTAWFSAYPLWKEAPAGTEARDRLTSELFGTAGEGAANWVAPFEVLSVLLLAALIGSIVIAMKERSA